MRVRNLKLDRKFVAAMVKVYWESSYKLQSEKFHNVATYPAQIVTMKQRMLLYNLQRELPQHEHKTI